MRYKTKLTIRLQLTLKESQDKSQYKVIRIPLPNNNILILLITKSLSPTRDLNS